MPPHSLQAQSGYAAGGTIPDHYTVVLAGNGQTDFGESEKMRTIARGMLLTMIVLTTGCVIVVDGTEDSPDAHWIGDYETKVEVRREENEV